MKLTFKLVFGFVVGNVLLAAVYGYLTVRREVLRFEQTAREDAQRLGKALQDSVAEHWRRSGREGVGKLLQTASTEQYRLRIRWVWFDRSGGGESPSAPSAMLTTVAIQRHLAIRAPGPDGTPCLHAYWPVPVDGPRPGGLEFSRPVSDLEESKRDIFERTAVLIGGIVSLSGLLSAVLGLRFVAQPLNAIIEKTRRIGSGDLTTDLHLQSRDELGELAESLNWMCAELAASQNKIRQETAARIAAMEQLRHADRLKTIGRLASGIAHELGTPLNVVAGRAVLIASGKLSADEINQSASAIRAEAERMTKIMRQLLDFARRSTPKKCPVDLRQLVEQTIRLLAPFAEKHGVRLCWTPPADAAVVQVDVGQIQQVVTNLVINATQAMPRGGEVRIALDRRSAQPPGEHGGEASYYCLEVQDEGEGIPEDNLPYLFEPFFTTKEMGEGTGLGLSIVYGIVQEHGGWIDVESHPGEGSCFRVYLPEEVRE